LKFGQYSAVVGKKKEKKVYGNTTNAAKQH
jgi:hypothetical protein